MQTSNKQIAGASDAVLLTDRRGMQTLAAACPPIDWDTLAKTLLNEARTNRVLLCTGFPVNGRPETDGPPGTLLLAHALRQLDGRVAIVSLPAVLEALDGLAWSKQIEMIGLPGGTAGPRLDGVAVTVEACGRTADGTYRNMRGVDITPVAPWFETVIGDRALISVGDGGNEFGFGAVGNDWFERFSVRPPASYCRYLVPAEVSNWGALAIVAALQRVSGAPLMPEPAAYQALLGELAQRGMVDGFSGQAAATEDGLEPEAATPVIEALTRWAARTSHAAAEDRQR